MARETVPALCAIFSKSRFWARLPATVLLAGESAYAGSNSGMCTAMSYADYIPHLVDGDGTIDQAAFLCIESGAVQGQSDGFIGDDEAAVIKVWPGPDAAVACAGNWVYTLDQLNTDFADTSEGAVSFANKGATVGGAKYFFTRPLDETTVYCKKGAQGVMISKTATLIIVAHHPDGIEAAPMFTKVAYIRDYLASSGY
eukprot:gene10208-1844_t